MSDRKNSDSEDIRSPYQLRTTQTELKYLEFQSRRPASAPIPSELSENEYDDDLQSGQFTQSHFINNQLDRTPPFDNSFDNSNLLLQGANSSQESLTGTIRPIAPAALSDRIRPSTSFHTPEATNYYTRPAADLVVRRTLDFIRPPRMDEDRGDLNDLIRLISKKNGRFLFRL